MPDRSPLVTGAPHRNLLVFQVSNRIAALPVECVERIAPMAELSRPPGMPSVLEGVLNLAGSAVPVLRLDRLLKLALQRVDLYSMLVVVRDTPHRRFAILVDRVNQVLPVSNDVFLPIAGEDSFNACSEATVTVGEDAVHVLSPAHLLLEKERMALGEFHKAAQRRLREWEGERT